MKGFSMKAPKVKVPTAPKAASIKTKVHPASQMRVRLPTGNVDMGQNDPGVSEQGIGKF